MLSFLFLISNKCKFPTIHSKSFQSNLYHTKLISDIVKLYINELPVKREYKQSSMDVGFRTFKKHFKDDLRRENKEVTQFRENLPENVNKDHIDKYRSKVETNIEKQKELKDLGVINVIMNHNKAEVLFDTTYDSLYKHGYRAIEHAARKNESEDDNEGYRRSILKGTIRETLAAASIIQSGIIERAHQTGKLYLWDPFCGSGTFLIEAIQMLKGDPLKREHMKFCFEHWPIFNEDEFNKEKEEMFNSLLNYELPPNIDIRVVGSDIKMFKDYIHQAEIHKYRYSPTMSRKCNFKDNPLILSYHYPELNRKYYNQISDYVESNETSVSLPKVGSLIEQDPPFFSFYKGDFEVVARHIRECFGSFEHFNIVTNIPYGEKVMQPKRAKNTKKKIEKGIILAEDQKLEYSEIQNLFRRFGKLALHIAPEMNDNIYIVARKMRNSNPLSFERYSNAGWDPIMDFYNGGLNVNMLKINPQKISKATELVNAYDM